MLDRRDERDVLQLMTTGVPALAPCRALGVLLDDDTWTPAGPAADGGVPLTRACVEAVPPGGGPVPVAGEAWAWALPMRTRDGLIGHLIVVAPSAPDDNELGLLRTLAQQAAVAVGNARLHASSAAVNAALAESVTALEYKTAIHDRFTAVAVAGSGYDGIVAALAELTGLASGIEDQHGQVLASSGVEGLTVKPSAKRAALIERSLSSGRPVRGDGRLLQAVRVRADAVGVLFVADPDERAGEAETVALEHGSTVLAIELARLLTVTEAELRLGVDVLTDLVTGVDLAGAVRRARALGRDLSQPQRVVSVGVQRSKIEPDTLLHLVREAVPEPHPALLMHRGDTVVVLLAVKSADDRGPIGALASRLKGTPPGASLRLGVGGVCGPDEVPRSLREAGLALRIPQLGGRSAPLVYDDLGVYQLLADVTELDGIDAFVRRWLGDLIDLDAARHSELVPTLAAFLDAGGRYEAAAARLSIGRSTLRYRLGRIKDLAPWNLDDPEARFQVHLATKAWFTHRALSR